jgi:hypothetical protein
MCLCEVTPHSRGRRGREAKERTKKEKWKGSNI